MKFVAKSFGWIFCLFVTGCLLSPDTRPPSIHAGQASSSPASPAPLARGSSASTALRPAGPAGAAPPASPWREGRAARVAHSNRASRRLLAAAAKTALPVASAVRLGASDPLRTMADDMPDGLAAEPTPPPLAVEPAPRPLSPALDPPAIPEAPAAASPTERTGVSAMSIPAIALPELGQLPRHLLLYGGLVLLGLLFLLWAWRARRHRARRAELRVWNPGKAQHPPSPHALVDEVLEPPAWLANATIRRRVSPSAPNPDSAPVPPQAAPARPAVAAAETRPVAAPTTQAHPAPAPVAAPAEPVETAPATSGPVTTATTPSEHVPSGSYSAALRGTSLKSPPIPHVTVHLDNEPAAAPARVVPSDQATLDMHNATAPADTNAVAPARIATADTPLEAPPIAAASVAASGELPHDDAPLDPVYAQARRLAAQGRQAEALAVLRPALDDNAPATAWAMAGWCAWTLAEQSSSPLALAEEAARAFERAIALDPSREGALSRMVGRCHLLQADADAPARRGIHLAAATAAYDRGHAQGMTSESALLEWAQALYEFAVHDALARPALLTRLDALLARGPDAAHAPSPWSRQRARAAWLRASIATTAAERHRLDQQAAAHAQRAYEALDDVAVRAAWLAESIEGGRRHLATLSPAARSDGYRSLAQRLGARLPEARGTAPWLAWVHVLADTSQWLQGPAARLRLAEADAILARLEAQADETNGNPLAVTFARAYYQRLRAMHESGGTRRQVLAHAAELLGRLRDHPQFPAQAGVMMEQAEVALALAGEGRDAQRHFEQAAQHASAAADIPQTRVPAFGVLLAALVGLQQLQPSPARAQQIALVAQWLAEADAPASAGTLRLLAAAALSRQDMAEAARLSAAAWEAGAEPDVLLPGWRQADAAWAHQLAETAERSAWERQHRLLRLAASSR